MRILFLGDVVGKAGRLAVKQFLPVLRERLHLDVVLANGENIAGGIGMTGETLDELFAAGVDFVTSGNHVWRHREIFSRLEKDRRILRPANYPEGAPGRGHGIFTLKDGRRFAVLNMLGTTYMEPLPCPFRTALSWAESAEIEDVAIRLVDFHAEATSEKKTMGWALDGKVSAVLGTHTHVQTADAQILPHGTAYLTDLGMCGVEQSSLGMDFEIVLNRFLTRMPAAFKPAKGDISLNGAYMDINDITGRAREIRIIREHCPHWKMEKDEKGEEQGEA
ncbi:MAG: YmdB family metallophosphoesterase [Mailhella sp.]|nr:YmdB family metallophosphoesterase [Mailhella sp.]